MARLMNLRQAKIMSLSVNYSFLAIHILLLILFRKYGVVPMMYFNIGSVLFYFFLPLLIYKDLLRAFCICTYLEVVAHMTCAVYFTGWDSSFQVTLIGMGILTAYSEYAGRYLRVPYLRSTPISCIGMAAYLLICVVEHYHAPQYPLPEEAVYYFRLLWGFITFGITLFFLDTFVRLSAGTEEILSREVDHDQLTGLPNRYYLWDYLNSLDRESRLEGKWVAMLDIDDFKKINDTYGHNCGDYILKEIAEILRSCGDSIQVCRWGGEEFLLFGDIGDSFEKSRLEVDALRAKIAGYPFLFEDQQLHVTVTIGMAEYRKGSTARAWIGAADQKMYTGKHGSKNCVVA